MNLKERLFILFNLVLLLSDYFIFFFIKQSIRFPIILILFLTTFVNFIITLVWIIKEFKAIFLWIILFQILILIFLGVFGFFVFVTV